MKQAIMFASTIPTGDAKAGHALDDANARRYSADTQALFRLVQELRVLVMHERAEAADLRERLRPYLDGEHHTRWRSAQVTVDDAEDALHEANAALAAARGAPELEAERIYKDARVSLERAFFEYRAAHRELSVLVAIYMRAAR